MKQKQLRINANITVQEKNLYTEQDNLNRDLPDKVSFTIDGDIINYTIEMDSTTNQQNPEKIPYRFAKACAAIEKSIPIKRPLKNFFINILGYTGLLLPYCKEIVPYCEDKNNSSLAAVGCLTTILIANYLKGYFERKEEEACKLRAEKETGQKSVNYKYKEFRRLDEFGGKKDGKPYILNISAIKPIIPEM